MDDLCLILQDKQLAGMAPEEGLYPAADPEFDGIIGCRLDPGGQGGDPDGVARSSARITFDFRSENLSSSVALHREFIAGSKDQDGPCPGGASDPAVAAGASAETSLLCETGEESLFEYAGKFTNGELYFRVMRPASFGAITADEAQGWIEVVVSKLAEYEKS